MNQGRQWQKCCLAALLAASLAAPAAAAERSGPAARARGGALGLREVLGSVLSGWLGELGRITATWGEGGNTIDPNGLQVTNPPTVSTTGIATTGTPPQDGGVVLDPDG